MNSVLVNSNAYAPRPLANAVAHRPTTVKLMLLQRVKLMLLQRGSTLFIAILFSFSVMNTGVAQSPDHNPDTRNLRIRAEKARAAAQTHVDLGTFEGVPPDVPSLDDALNGYSCFILKPLAAETVIENGRDILTWYKARIVAKLFLGAVS